MAKFNASCRNCGYKGAIIRARAPDFSTLPCPKCATLFLERDEEPATTRITEVLDNGLMSRRVERLADVERMVKDRVVADKKSRQ